MVNAFSDELQHLGRVEAASDFQEQSVAGPIQDADDPGKKQDVFQESSIGAPRRDQFDCEFTPVLFGQAIRVILQATLTIQTPGLSRKSRDTHDQQI